LYARDSICGEKTIGSTDPIGFLDTYGVLQGTIRLTTSLDTYHEGERMRSTYRLKAQEMGLPGCVNWDAHWRWFMDDDFERLPESKLDEEMTELQATDIIGHFELDLYSVHKLLSIIWQPTWYAELYDATAHAVRAAGILALLFKLGHKRLSVPIDEDDLACHGNTRAANKVCRSNAAFTLHETTYWWSDWQKNAEENARERRAGCWKRTATKPRKQWHHRANLKTRRQCKPMDYWGWKVLEDSGEVSCKVSPFVGETEKLRLPIDAVGSTHSLREIRYTNDEMVAILGARQEDAQDEAEALLAPGEFGMSSTTAEWFESLYQEDVRELGDEPVWQHEEIFGWHLEEQLLWEIKQDLEKLVFRDAVRRMDDELCLAMTGEPDYGWNQRVDSYLF